MRILVVGGTGHIGSYLVPRLVQAKHEVQIVARHEEPRYSDLRLLWNKVEWLMVDRRAEEIDGSWQKRMARLDTDAVIDLTCFTPEQNEMMVSAFRGRVCQFLHCGSIWAYGPPARIPYREKDPRRPITEYGRLKATIEANLLSEYRKEGFPATVIHPGHISGKQWLPIDPQGTRNGAEIYERLARGGAVHLPDRGLATLHHVHADDVAQMFELAILNREEALGESFSAVAPYAMTLRACSEFVASLFGKEPNILYVPLEELEILMGSEAFAITRDHVDHSPCCSIEKAQRLLGYQPRYTIEQIYTECIEYLLESRRLRI